MTVQVSTGNSVTVSGPGQYYGIAIYKNGVQLYNTLPTSGATGANYVSTSGGNRIESVRYIASVFLQRGSDSVRFFQCNKHMVHNSRVKII
jgi:hypothetical protein